MDSPPPEILIYIFSFSSFLTLIKSQRVNKKWYQIIDSFISGLPYSSDLSQTFKEGELFWEQRGRKHSSLFIKKIRIDADYLFFTIKDNILLFDFSLRRMNSHIVCSTMKSNLSFSLIFEKTRSGKRLTSINMRYYRKKKKPDIIVITIGYITTFISSRSCGKTPIEYFEFSRWNLIRSIINSTKKMDPFSHFKNWLELRPELCDLFSFKNKKLILNKRIINEACSLLE
jgi:hypothetical protein